MISVSSARAILGHSVSHTFTLFTILRSTETALGFVRIASDYIQVQSRSGIEVMNHRKQNSCRSYHSYCTYTKVLQVRLRLFNRNTEI